MKSLSVDYPGFKTPYRAVFTAGIHHSCSCVQLARLDPQDSALSKIPERYMVREDICRTTTTNSGQSNPRSELLFGVTGLGKYTPISPRETQTLSEAMILQVVTPPNIFDMSIREGSMSFNMTSIRRSL
jgi:hypothetical protein